MTEIPDRDGNYIFAHELNPETARPETTKRLIRRLEDHYNTYDNSQYELNLRSSEKRFDRIGSSEEWEHLRVKEMPDELANFIAKEKEELANHMQKNGIDPKRIHWNKIYYAEPINMNLSPADIIAKTGVLSMQLPDLPIEIRGVKFFQEAILAGHELYHNTAPHKFRIYLDSFHHQHYEFELERSGIQYHHKDEGEGPTALEEGLCFKWQLESERRARKMFPKGAEDYDMALKRAVATGAVDKDRQLFTIQSWNLKNEIEYGANPRDPVDLVEYLESQIIDFIGLIERARVDHKTLDLARHIEAKFGMGSYKKIVIAPIEKARDLIKELQNTNSTAAGIL